MNAELQEFAALRIVPSYSNSSLHISRADC